MTPLDALLARDRFSDAEIVRLLSLSDPKDIERLRQAAFDLATAKVGDTVHYRGLVELSNICSLDCRYCGIRKGNHQVERYALNREEIVTAALWCAQAGYGSCVLQAGERRDADFISLIEDCVREIRFRSVAENLPQGLGVTLSLGEQSLETYRRWRTAGAHRYLLRIETTNPDLFARIHPPAQRLETRLQALDDLRAADFQVGTGVMIGLPGQTVEDLAADVRFFRDRDIDMIGMGPYIVAPGNAMPEKGMMDRGELVRLSLKMIAVVRLVLRDVNIAATTALQTLIHDGRERGISFGANVAMPNVTPVEMRRNYQLYDGKPCLDEGRDECRGCLAGRVQSVSRHVGWNDWGDSPHYAKRSGGA